MVVAKFGTKLKNGSGGIKSNELRR
jgi:hypothetical protein